MHVLLDELFEDSRCRSLDAFLAQGIVQAPFLHHLSTFTVPCKALSLNLSLVLKHLRLVEANAIFGLNVRSVKVEKPLGQSLHFFRTELGFALSVRQSRRKLFKNLFLQARYLSHVTKHLQAISWSHV